RGDGKGKGEYQSELKHGGSRMEPPNPPTPFPKGKGVWGLGLLFLPPHRLDNDVLHRHILMRALASGADHLNLVYHVHAVDDSAEYAVPGVESALIQRLLVIHHVDEKLSRRAIGIIRAGHGDRATEIGQAIIRFVFDRVVRFLLFHAGLEAAT